MGGVVYAPDLHFPVPVLIQAPRPHPAPTTQTPNFVQHRSEVGRIKPEFWGFCVAHCFHTSGRYSA